MEEEGPKNDAAGMMRWLLTYADMITLLLVYFIVLFSLSVVQKQKYEALVQALHAVLNGKGAMVTKVVANKKAPYPLHYAHNGKTQPKSQSQNAATQNKNGTQGQQLVQEKNLYQQIQAAVDKNHLQQDIRVSMIPYGVQVVFLNGILFPNASSALQPEAIKALTVIGDVVAPIQNSLIVQGFTNSLKIDTPTYPSNWNLSVERAATVIDYWRRVYSIAPTRFMAEGFGAWAPLASNNTTQGRAENRAAAVVVLNRAVNLRQVAFGPIPPS